jgi:hypothetical protein
MEEIWKDIDGFYGYQVSTHGRVKTIDRLVWNPANQSKSLLKGMIRKLDLVGKIYPQIGLSIESKTHKRLVHRLVAQAFIPNPENLPEVNHKDKNPLNNRVDNLEWVSRLGNMQHRKDTGGYDNMPRGEQRPNAILTREAVIHIRQKVLRNIDYCRLYGVKPTTVSCLQSDKYGRRWPD